MDKPGLNEIADSHNPRVMQRARKLWHDDGEPAGGPDSYLDRARELIAIEINGHAATIPLAKAMGKLGPYGEPIEEAEIAIRNQGEFPTLTDQGEEPMFPQAEGDEDDEEKN